MSQNPINISHLTLSGGKGSEKGALNKFRDLTSLPLPGLSLHFHVKEPVTMAIEPLGVYCMYI